MQHVRPGSSGLKVFRLALDCLSYGEPGLGTHPWPLPEEESLPFLAQALDLGVNFFDTANVYSLGTSEEFLGRALRKLTRREDVVVATKVYEKLDPNPLSGGLSRLQSRGSPDTRHSAFRPSPSRGDPQNPEQDSAHQWRDTARRRLAGSPSPGRASPTHPAPRNQAVGHTLLYGSRQLAPLPTRGPAGRSAEGRLPCPPRKPAGSTGKQRHDLLVSKGQVQTPARSSALCKDCL
ncbi:aldo/keto reductase [Streptomyces sp. Y7]|uniref:aldo/keto reductase n=1 Tax=Streptomyces sp. Y7 TaxID=3342392 RepID=UPI00372482FA